MVRSLGVGYSGQSVTCDGTYKLTTWLRPSSTDVVCAELLPHWPRPVCCQDSQVGLGCPPTSANMEWSKWCLT